MYAVDSASTSLSCAKSTIQALLKSKEQRPRTIKPLDSDWDQSFPNNQKNSPECSLVEILAQNTDTKSTYSVCDSFNPSNAENLDHQRDFSYSQKLFHIADGNLYSIFSPIQGRSYGMKPSFLRKQKYTVQECHNRGRKNLRKGLKFHNFLPSESVTSEKDNGFLNSKWKVHSECRLKEEHGTKQITISNWSHSVQNPSSEELKETNPDTRVLRRDSMRYDLPKLDDENTDSNSNTHTNDPYDFNLTLQQSSCEKSETFIKFNKTRIESKIFSPTAPKKDSLDSVVSSLMEKPHFVENKSYVNDELQNNFTNHKHRRKPVQTRRIVPYVKYLSIIEENESLPLDLSSKCMIENSASPSPSSDNDSSIKNDCYYNIVRSGESKNSLNYTVVSDLYKNSSNEKMLQDSNINNKSESGLVSPLAVLCPVPINKSTIIDQNNVLSDHLLNPCNSKVQMNADASAKMTNSYATFSPFIINQAPMSSSFSLEKSFVKESQPKSRRRNQRSVIKQKLEDTFRQNGFLVKTKQVSDGEATFCKFRQLRKYTRYYLKSLEQHLPDEFHKMWKGFLPPKTVLPPISGTPDATSESI